MSNLYSQAEFNAAFAAIKADIAQNVPGWEASMIPDAALESAVGAVLQAAAQARAKQSDSS